MATKRPIYSKPINQLNGISIHSRNTEGKEDFVLSKDGKYIQEFSHTLFRPVIVSYRTQHEAETAAIHYQHKEA